MRGNPLYYELPFAFRAFRWQPRTVKKVRGAFRIETERETIALKPLHADKERLTFLHRVSKHLQESGYAHALPWIETKDGEAFYVGKKVSFYATPWHGTEWSRRSPISGEALIQSLAVMHHVTERLAEEARRSQDHTFAQDIKRWEEQREWLQARAETAGRREFPSPVDVFLLENVDELTQAAAFAIDGLKKMSASRQAAQPFRRVVCHRRVHRHNLVCERDTWKWIDFAHAGFHSPTRDVATFIKRFPPPEEADALEELTSLLRAYEEQCPLTLREKQLLGLYLAFPEPVIKRLGRYDARPHKRGEIITAGQLARDHHYFQICKQFVKAIWPDAKKTR